MLVVASPAYRERSGGAPVGDVGRGVRFEGAILRELLYADRDTWLPRLLPVLLPGATPRDLPTWLGPTSTTVYRIREMTVAGAEELLRTILDRPPYPPVDLGPTPALPPVGQPPPRPGLGDRIGQLSRAQRIWAERGNRRAR